MKELTRFQDLIEVCMEAKEFNRDVFVELTLPGQEDTEIIIIKNSNIDYKLRYYSEKYNNQLELINCKDIKILRAGTIMWDVMQCM